MKLVTLVLVTFLGLAAWAGNGFERGYFIDFGSYKVSNVLKGRLSKQLAEACPDLVASHEAGPVVRVHSAKVAWENNHKVYKIGLSFIERSSDGPPFVASDRVVKMTLVNNVTKRWPWMEPEIIELETECP